MRVLAGDVGGTKTLLALYEGEPRGLREIAARRFESARYDGPTAILAELMREHEGPIDAAALGVAGPVEGGACRTTNLPWHLDERTLSEELGLPRVRLLNDFAAVALGLGELGEDALEVLHDRPIDPAGPQAVIGAGTGLGEAILIPQKPLPRVLPTEGGHADFAPRNEDEIELLRFLWKRHGRVSIERVLSGAGLVTLFEHLRDVDPSSGSPALLEAEDPAAAIGEAALAGADRAAERALSMFVSIYGSEAGNLALKTLPTGGLFVAGGIAAKILPAILGGGFMHALLDKGRMRPVLDSIRVTLVTDPRVGLYGARRVAASLAEISAEEGRN